MDTKIDLLAEPWFAIHAYARTRPNKNNHNHNKVRSQQLRCLPSRFYTWRTIALMLFN